LRLFKKIARVAEKKQKAKETFSQAPYDRDRNSRDGRTRARNSNSNNKNEKEEALAPIKTKVLRYNSSHNGLVEKKNTRMLLREKNKA
jgi:hypothetical protein